MASNSQWKSPKQDGDFFDRSSSFGKSSNNSNSSSSSGAGKEAGIIEKLLHSYGFIQCCEKQSRLFFHYSQFDGNIDFLKVGDAVEFETAYDRKTGKPIARDVAKISSFAGDSLSEERVSGVVTTEIKNGNEGRIAYENRGECFFLPYSVEDVAPDTKDLQPGDKVTFMIVTDKQNGNPTAQQVRLERPHPERHQGVICTLKETFGFIERADEVKEIFFHASECKDFRSLNLGDDVEFFIQFRNNKEVATSIVCLPPGTVVFEDISPDRLTGQVIKVIDRFQSRQASDPLPGRICYRRDNKQMEIPFGDKDCGGDCTLREGDFVQFSLAVDKRDKLQRATNIHFMLDESFAVSDEKREQGVITALKDSFGFIKYGKRDDRLYFRYSEVVDSDQFKVHDEVEFTVIQDPASPSRYQAVRIRMLPTEQLDHSFSNEDRNRRNVGVIEREAQPARNGDKFSSSQGCNGVPRNGREDGCDGLIAYQHNGECKRIAYSFKDCAETRIRPGQGDKVEFFLNASEDNGAFATEVRLARRTNTRNGFGHSHQGYIAALKETFGFIENEEHDKEIFFHFSVFEGNPSQLELGQEVEYDSVMTKGNKLSAECVRKLPMGTIPCNPPLPDILSGTVVRTVRCFNHEQEDYCGLIQVSSNTSEEEPNVADLDKSDDNDDIDEEEEEEEEEEDLGEQEMQGGDNICSEEDGRQRVPFGMASLVDKQDMIQVGDIVQFQLSTNAKTGQEWALNVQAVRTKLQSVVDWFKGSFGFLSHEVEEGKKLFFHITEVKNRNVLRAGDLVEFTLMHNQRNGKYSACGVVKIRGAMKKIPERPERLLSRLRSISFDENTPKIIVLRQPRGPDGTDGFKTQRTCSLSVVPENGIAEGFNFMDNEKGV